MKKKDLIEKVGELLEKDGITENINTQTLNLDSKTIMWLFEYFKAYGGELNNASLIYLIKEGIKSHKKMKFLEAV